MRGKRVILVDDSIVRGTTSRPIVKQLRDAGATEVHFLSSAPKFLNPCYYGTDIDSRENLIACHHTTEEIAQIIYPTEIPQSAGKDRFEQRPIVGRPISENPKFQNQTKKA